MKKMNLYAITFLIVLLASVGLSAQEQPKKKLPASMPKKVKNVVENKCYGCHNINSKNDKAKEDLDFTTLDGLGKIKKIGAYKHIIETIEKEEMPPQKFLARNPDKKLTEEEAKLIMDWAKKEASSLIGK